MHGDEQAWTYYLLKAKIYVLISSKLASTCSGLMFKDGLTFQDMYCVCAIHARTLLKPCVRTPARTCALCKDTSVDVRQGRESRGRGRGTVSLSQPPSQGPHKVINRYFQNFFVRLLLRYLAAKVTILNKLLKILLSRKVIEAEASGKMVGGLLDGWKKAKQGQVENFEFTAFLSNCANMVPQSYHQLK